MLKVFSNGAHLSIQTFPSEVFSPSDKPFLRPQSIEMGGNMVVFTTKKVSAALYFTKKVKFYIDGGGTNFHIATPATDFIFSADTSLEEVLKQMRSALKVAKGFIGTYLDANSIKSPDLEEYIGSFEGEFIYVSNTKKKQAIEIARAFGKKTVGKGKNFDLNIGRSWKVVPASLPIQGLQMLETRVLASSFIASPVFLSSNIQLPEVRKWIEPEMLETEKNNLPPIAPAFFYFPDDNRISSNLHLLMFSKGLLYIPSLHGERKRYEKLPTGTWMNLKDLSIHSGWEEIATGSLFLKEDWAIVMNDGDSVKVVAFVKEGFSKSIFGRRVSFATDGIEISEGPGIRHWEIVVRTPDKIREVSFRLAEARREVKI